MKLLIACKVLSGSSHSTWSQDTGRSRWMKRVHHWLHSQWGHSAPMNVKGCLIELTNAPATFQRLMETCLGDLNLHWYIIYLDDIVIFSIDLASHLKRLEAVFQKLQKAGLKLKPSKCEQFHCQIAYLGHMISTQGVDTDEGKIDAIKNGPTPTNITEVQIFLGFMGYYHQFIPKFMQVAWPLHEFTSDENAGKKKAAIQWNSKCQQAFNDLKRLYHCTYSYICRFHLTIQASHWCLWLWFGSCPLSDLWGWHRCCNTLCQ